MHAVMKYLVSGLICLQASFAVAFAGLGAYPGAELVGEEAGDEPVFHLIVLGSLEKVNHELEPEESSIVKGIKSSQTFYLPQARRTKEVMAFYAAQLESQGEIVFQCRGRGCGSSSYWANKILGRAFLYGPEQHQHFMIAELPDEAGYLAVYVGQRATRKIYVHLEQVKITESD